MSRGRPRDPEADRAILDAAGEIFLERGVEGTSIEQVAKRAGVGKLTVYRRWPSKEDLIAQAVETLVTEEIPWPSPEQIASRSPYELVEQGLDATARAAASPRLRALVARVFGSSVSHPALMEIYWRGYILPRRELTRALLARAQEEGSVAPDADLDALTDMLAGATTYRMLRPDPPDADAMRAYLRSLYVQVGLLR
ncbi:TetR/AcrR family transcriptional regulator [Amycolatopsis suaedae]|uniref:TetR/AcrR family transcriptional regulator n=1 Tax=Amycolatopsis suaedae TaxID=2510978 RepID=A0A4Q7J892_9PSEU|nr:TetR/AcrR family transcriptional regulator [Amycolatopsis suaedae]RZQ63427.1 TetR/AcrR family transcriptional regulator [Amycolatopsis suaedae]